MLLLAHAAHAGDAGELWIWHLTGFMAPQVGSSSFTREGTARAKVSNGKVEFETTEARLPEFRGIFRGKMEQSGVTGTLDGFFTDGPRELTGRYREMRMNERCLLREIDLTPSVPSGEALLLFRAEGDCQLPFEPGAH
jgi:hypothetical protein